VAKRKPKKNVTDLQKAKRAPKNYSKDPRLDRMYGQNIRCPYCKMTIAKFTTTCVQCGITKEQIAYASHQDAKKIMQGKDRGLVLYTRTIPRDLNFTKFLLCLVFLGLFGGHYFYIGRKIRGFLMLGSIILLFVSVIVFPFGNFEDIEMHSFRAAASWDGAFFPLDVPGIIAIVVWFVDWFAIVVFNRFKYPVRIRGKNTPFNN